MSDRLGTVQPAPIQIHDALLGSLRRQIGGQVLTPGDTGYDDARLIWNGMFDRKPALVVCCKDRADVVAAVNFARDNKLLVAVKGGGHNSSGSGSCDDGIVIDLSAMKAVSVDPDLRRSRVQGGATWGDFDRAAQAFGLATPGGLVSATGVGGLTLAGGLGWLRGKFGLCIDNVISAEIVTADGKVRVANPSENADLFWALRGGGGNFGVVTMFEFALHPIGPEVMFLGAIYRAEDAAQVIKGWRDFMKTGPDEIGGSLVEFSTIPEDPGYPKEAWRKRVLSLVGVWAGDPSEGERAIEPLRQLATPLIDMSGRMSYCSIQQMYDAMFPKGRYRAYFKSIYLNGLDDALIEEIAIRSTSRPSELSLCSVWYMGGAVSRVARDATAFGERSMQYMLSIDSIWKDRRDDQQNLSWSRTFWHDMRGRSGGRAYLNFAGLGEEGEDLVRAGYGVQNYERLAEIKASYDPTNMFCLNQNIKPRAATALRM